MKLTCLATNSSEAYQRPVLPNPLQVSVLIDPENPLHFDLGSSSDEDEGGEPDERPAATPAAARASLGAEEAATHCEGGEGSEATLALASGAPKATAEGVAVQRGGTRTRASQAVRSRPKARGGGRLHRGAQAAAEEGEEEEEEDDIDPDAPAQLAGSAAAADDSLSNASGSDQDSRESDEDGSGGDSAHLTNPNEPTLRITPIAPWWALGSLGCISPEP